MLLVESSVQEAIAFWISVKPPPGTCGLRPGAVARVLVDVPDRNGRVVVPAKEIRVRVIETVPQRPDLSACAPHRRRLQRPGGLFRRFERLPSSDQGKKAGQLPRPFARDAGEGLEGSVGGRLKPRPDRERRSGRVVLNLEDPELELHDTIDAVRASVEEEDVVASRPEFWHPRVRSGARRKHAARKRDVDRLLRAPAEDLGNREGGARLRLQAARGNDFRPARGRSDGDRRALDEVPIRDPKICRRAKSPGGREKERARKKNDRTEVSAHPSNFT